MRTWRGPCILIALASALLAGAMPGWRYVSFARTIGRARQVVWSDNPSAAVEEIRRLRRRFPQNAELAYLLAVAQRRDGKTSEARAELKRASELGWSRKEVLRQTHFIDFQAGQIAKTQPYLLEILDEPCADDLATEVYECLVKGYLADVRIRDADRVVEYWLQWKPDSVLAHLLRSEVLEAVNDKTEQMEEYRKILKLDPSNRLARMRLGFLLFENKDMAGAKEEFARYLAGWPDDGVVSVGLAACERQLGDLDKAEALLEKALAGELPDAQRGFALTELGQIAMSRRDYDAARDHLQQAVLAFPASFATHYNLAMVLAHFGEHQVAEEHLEASRKMTAQAERLDELIDRIVVRPKDADLRCEAGEILLEQGNFKEASLWLLSALRCDQSHPATHRALARYYAAMGDTEMSRNHAVWVQRLTDAAPTAETETARSVP